jgi:E1A/CREB-binding protein
MQHISGCVLADCLFDKCNIARISLGHFRQCNTETCYTCIPARLKLQEHLKIQNTKIRATNLYMALLDHSASCDGIECKSENCKKMKELMKHGDENCAGCDKCKNLNSIYRIHNRRCTKKDCTVPGCTADVIQTLVKLSK